MKNTFNIIKARKNNKNVVPAKYIPQNLFNIIDQIITHINNGATIDYVKVPLEFNNQIIYSYVWTSSITNNNNRGDSIWQLYEKEIDLQRSELPKPVINILKEFLENQIQAPEAKQKLEKLKEIKSFW